MVYITVKPKPLPGEVQEAGLCREIANPRLRHDSVFSHNSIFSSDPTDETLVAEEMKPVVGEKTVVDVPPNGGFGWVCVACVFMINAHTWGINSSYGVFLAHYLANGTFPGATPLQYAFIGGLSISLALLVSPLATICTRHYGTKVTLSIGIFLEVGGLLGASFAKEMWHLFVSQGLAFGFGMGFLFVATVGVVPQWFTTKRSFANSIGTAGSGIGGLIYSLAANAMIESISLQWTFRILAILALVVNTVSMLLIRDRNKAVGSVHKALNWALFTRVEYWLLMGWGFFSMLGYVVLLFSLPNYAKSVGLTAAQGSVVGAVLNLGQAIGRPVVGYFSDAVGRLNMASGATFLCGFLCFVFWIFAKTYGVLVVFALLVGTVSGTFWATAAPVGAEVVGLKILPTALSCLWVFLVIPTTFSEPIGLQLRSGEDGMMYLYAQVFAGSMYIAAAGCAWLLRAWKVAEVDRLALSDDEKEMERRDGDVAGEKIEDEQGVLRKDQGDANTNAECKRKRKGLNLRGLWGFAKV